MKCIRASLLSAILFGLTYYLPVFLLRSRYSGEAIDPLSASANLIVLLYMPLGLIPAVTLLTWFPGASKCFKSRLSKVSQSSALPPLRTQHLWHWGAAIAIILIGAYPTLVGVTHDAIIEWFEASGILGWSAFVAGFLVGWSIGIVALVQVLHFTFWLKKVLSFGLDINPFYPDGSGGLKFTGSMLDRLSLFAAVMALFLAYIGLMFYFRNNDGQLAPALDNGLFIILIILVAVYVVLVSVLLLFPAFVIRRAMVAERDKLLESAFLTVSNQFREQGDAYDKTAWFAAASYFMVKQSYPVMPFTTLPGAILRLLTLVTPVVGLTSGVYTLVTRSG